MVVSFVLVDCGLCGDCEDLFFVGVGGVLFGGVVYFFEYFWY